VTALVARAATPQDAELLLAWRNDAETRRWSRSSAPVTEEQHAAWLTSVLDDPARHLWVVEQDGRPVATVRHDRVVPGRFEVSVTVSPQLRGHGVGVPALSAAQRALEELEPQVVVLEAHVQPDNGASMRVFERAGYRPAGVDADGLALLELATGDGAGR